MFQTTLENEYAAWEEGLILFEDLSPSTAAAIRKHQAIERLGFTPDVFCQVAGVTFEGRQSTLAVAMDYANNNQKTLPVKLVPEPENKFDSNAVKVMLGTFHDVDGWYYEHVGYIPRSLCADCGKNVMGKDADKGVCKSCGSENLVSEFNVSVLRSLLDGNTQVGTHWISNQGGDRTTNIGVCIAIKL